jgi:predicted metalloprotease with PDZ domain
LEVGDKVLFFGGRKLTPTNFVRLLGRYKPGDRVALIVQRDVRTLQVSITLGEPQILNYRIEEMKDAPVETKALRAAWLSGK